VTAARRVLTVPALALVALAVPNAPAGAVGAAHQSTPTRHVRVYTQADSGRTVRATVGSTFKIRLTNCGSCGYRWRYSHRPDPQVMRVVHISTRSETKPGQVGGNERVTYTIRAVGRGTTSIGLVDQGPGTNPKIARRFHLKVIVRR
jgi:predicted secreted protein